MVIKLNMAKAYDRVEWNYLEVPMKALDFNEQWWRFISCIPSVSYSILLNGKPGQAVKPYVYG